MMLAEVNYMPMLSTSQINTIPTSKFPPPQKAIRLTCEVVLVWTAALTLIYVGSTYLNGRGDWLFTPAVLIILALMPARLRKIKLTEIGFNFGHLKSALLLTLVVSLIIFPVTVIGLLILRHFNMAAPWAPQIPSGSWLNWVFYQVMYLAVAEEIFFRGYLQSTIQQIFLATSSKYLRGSTYWTIIFSAGIFALAHVLLTNNALALVTFFPGIILGWLFLRTKTVISPIIFHALANIFYAGATCRLF